MLCRELEFGLMGVVRSGRLLPACGVSLSCTVDCALAICLCIGLALNMARRKKEGRLTFLQTQAQCGLCTAYFVTTSSIRLYSSEADRKARLRMGMLKKRSSAWMLCQPLARPQLWTVVERLRGFEMRYG
jgi:hypothetical protein